MDESNTLSLLEQLVKMAATGEHYAKDPYNVDRYKSLKELAEKLYASNPSFNKLQIEPYDEAGYITPKVGVNAIIFNEKGEYLLEQRADDSCWGIPGGWCEVGFTAEENVLREIHEETGLDAKVKQMLTAISRTPSSKQLFTSYHIIFHCEITGGTLHSSHESLSVAWKKLDDVASWHFDHREWMKKAIAELR